MSADADLTPGATSPRTDSGWGRRTIYKRAETVEELDQVHQLNHGTFAAEIGQHETVPTGRLVDKFDPKNCYYIASRGGVVVGMVAVHDEPPFSIADRLADPAALTRLAGRPLEVRLLAVRPTARHGAILAGLFRCVHRHALRCGHSHLLISGITHRIVLYERLGFRQLGPPVAEGDARFVPMALDLVRPCEAQVRYLRRAAAHRARRRPPPARVSLLPGPVEVAPGVAAAFRARAMSHRDPYFVAMFERARARLAKLAGLGDAGLFVGGGTLANDVILATLAADQDAGPGLILINGEFGERLARQARRAGLAFATATWPWGSPWDVVAVDEQLARLPTTRWVYGVHLETSTGMLNDLPGLIARARPRGVRVCADVVSSLGAVDLDLSGVHLAAAASGKSLGAFAGLAIVLAARDACDELVPDRIPASLDLAQALRSRGPTSTVGSPGLRALDRALDAFESPADRDARFRGAAKVGSRLRRGLRSLGLAPIAEERWAAPVVSSFVLPTGWGRVAFRDACRTLGFEVATSSRYLRRCGWAQVATMGAVTGDQVDAFLDGLAAYPGLDGQRS